MVDLWSRTRIKNNTLGYRPQPSPTALPLDVSHLAQPGGANQPNKCTGNSRCEVLLKLYETSFLKEIYLETTLTYKGYLENTENSRTTQETTSKILHC